MLFFDTPHHHAQVTCFDYDADALRIDRLLNSFCDLRGQAFLNLQAARENFN